MPYTRRQVRFLESKVSPLTAEQKDKMNEELHEDPALGHAKKGHFHLDRGHSKVKNRQSHAEKLRHA